MGRGVPWEGGAEQHGDGPSSFASDALGAWAVRLGGGLDAAAALEAEDPVEGGGTADPGALFGNLRIVLCAADLDAPEPILTDVDAVSREKWAIVSGGRGPLGSVARR